MKKKTVAAMLIGSMLLMPFPVFAAGSDKAPIETLDFDEIPELVEERHPDFKVLSSLVDKTAINLEIQEDSIRDSISGSLNSARSAINSQIAIYKGFINYYDELIKTADDDLKTTYEAIREGYSNVVNELEQSRDSLDSTGSSSWKEDFKEIEDLTMQSTHLGVKMGLNGYIYSMQKLFLTYQTLTDTLEDLKRQRTVLENSYDTLLLQQELGFVTEGDVAALEVNREKIKTGIDSMEQAMEDLIGSINLSLGQEYDSPLELGEAPSLDPKKIDAMHYYKDYETALKENLPMREKRLSYQLADEKLEQASGDEEDLAEIEFNNAELEWQEQEKKFAQTFAKTFRAVEDAQTNMENTWLEFSTKMTDWNQTQLKYELGLIAERDWENARITYDSDYSEYKAAQQALYEAYLDYEWLLKGMEFSTGSSAGTTGDEAQSTGAGA